MRGVVSSLFAVAVLVASIGGTMAQDSLVYVQNCTGVSGDGSDANPYVGWANNTACFGPGITTVFGEGIYEALTGTTLGDQSAVLCRPGAVIRRNTNGSSLLFFSSSGPHDVTISGCTFDGSNNGAHPSGYAYYDVYLVDAFDTGDIEDLNVIENRWINLSGNNNHFLVRVQGGATKGGKMVRVADNTVVGDSGPPATPDVSFRFAELTDVVVEGNTINSWGGIKFEPSLPGRADIKRIRVSDNSLYNINQTNIVIRCGGSNSTPTDLEGVIVSNNTGQIESMSVPKGLVGIGEPYPFHQECTARDVIVSGNSGRGYRAHNISLGGTGGRVVNATVTGNQLDGRDPVTNVVTEDSMGLTVNPKSENVSITGNSFTHTGRGCIRVGAERVSITGNVLEHCAQSDLGVVPSNQEAAILLFGADPDAPKDVTISGNVIKNSHTETLGAKYPNTAGITLESLGHPMRDIVISDNVIVDDRTEFGMNSGMNYGIRVGGDNQSIYPDNVLVTGNRISRMRTSPWISFGANGTRRRFVGNVFNTYDPSPPVPTWVEYAGWEIATGGLGAVTGDGSCLLLDNLSQRLFEDANCDGVKDTGEEFIGQ